MQFDRQPIRAAEIARIRASTWLPSDLQELLSPQASTEFNAFIAEALLGFVSPKSLSKPIRLRFPNLSSKDAVQCAVYVFAWAIETASMEKMLDMGVTHKRVIASIGCCPICQQNKDQGIVPIDELFRSGHMHAPFCFSCRCATSAARA